MRLEIHKYHGKNFAKLFSDNVILKTQSEISEMISNADFLGAQILIIKREHLSNDFYNLNTGLADAFWQEFLNSKIKMIIVGNLENYPNNRFTDFINECHNTGRLFFVESMHDAKQKMK